MRKIQMGKSSYSSKRKRPKHSSQIRTKKRSKTKRSRSKNLKHRDDSVSYSSDDSRSSASVSSSSEDSYKHRRSRSRTHKDVKASRRRARSYTSSSVETHRLRKRKRSRKNDDSGARKKTFRTKKNKKKKAVKVSSSSMSSGSRSCSTCWSSSSGSDGSENESCRGRSERRENSKRKLKDVKSRATMRRYRSRSCSSCSRYDGSSDHWSRKTVMDENNSKRLKSVITIAKDNKEGKQLDWDEYKEEMLCDHDDYPSSRSNDSNDGGNKRVAVYQPCGESEKKLPLEIEKKEDVSAFDMKTTKLPNSYKDSNDHRVESKPASDGVRINDALDEKNTKTSEAAGNVNANDLESTLRQKALENLRRFRGGIQTNAKSTINPKDENDVPLKSLSTTKSEANVIASPKDGGIQGAKGDSVHLVQKEGNNLDRNNGINDSVSAKNNAQIPNQMVVAGREKVKINLSPVTNKPRLVASAFKQALTNGASSIMESPDSDELNKEKLTTASNIDEHNVTPLKGNGSNRDAGKASGSASVKFLSRLTSAGVDVSVDKLQDEGNRGSQLEHMTVSSVTPLSSTDDNTTGKNTCGSTSVEPSSNLISAAKSISSSKGKDDDKEGSQLEQKTMSVMRGGEMVQVSYKVYIPNKAPALARRQLKR